MQYVCQGCGCQFAIIMHVSSQNRFLNLITYVQYVFQRLRISCHLKYTIGFRFFLKDLIGSG